MSTMRPYLRSFAAGIISPELLGRFDLLKYQTGLADALNMQVLTTGAIQNRAGTNYVLEIKDSAVQSRFLPFVYDQTTAYIIEMGNQYMRFHINGATLLESAKTVTGFTIANPGVFTSVAHGYTTGNWVFSTYAAQAPLHLRYFKVTVLTADTYTLADLYGVPFSTIGMSYAAGMTTGRVYEITHLFDSGVTPGVLQALVYSQRGNQLIVSHPGYRMFAISRLTASTFQCVALGNSANADPIGTPTLATGGPGGGTPKTYSYSVTAVDPEGIETVPGNSGTIAHDLSVVGNYIEVDLPTSRTAGEVCRVYRTLQEDGATRGIAGYVGSFAPGATGKFRDYNIAPDYASQPPTLATDPAGSNSAPAALCHYDNRLVYGGSNNDPLRVTGTNSGAPLYAITFHTPTRADDVIVADVMSRQSSRIKHIVPLEDLIVFTASGEFKIFSTQGPISNATISAKPQSYVGANDAQPVVSNSSILYASNKGSHIREMKFSWQQQAYEPADVSVMAPHLFDDYTITALALIRAPIPALWARRSDGRLLSMTYQPEHDVKAWTVHQLTDGVVEDICAIPEGTGDALYMLVRRTINSQTKRYIERLHTRSLIHSFESFFVDAGLTYTGAPVTSVSGMYHLEGQTVAILSNGAVQPQAVVLGGSVTFPDAGGIVTVGKPITSYLNTLPIRNEALAAAAGDFYSISRVHVRIFESSGFKVGPSLDSMREVPLRTTEPYGSPPSLITDEVDVGVGSDWGSNESVWVKQDDPLPLTVLSLGLELEV